MSAESSFRPAWVVHAQIRWDPRLDPDDFDVCTRDRLAGMVRVAFSDFVPGGRIPWSRVEAFLQSGQAVWSRTQRHDALRDLPRVVPPSMALASDVLEPLPIWHFEGGAWVGSG